MEVCLLCYGYENLYTAIPKQDRCCYFKISWAECKFKLFKSQIYWIFYEKTYININSCYRRMSFFYEGQFSWCLAWRKNTYVSFLRNPFILQRGGGGISLRHYSLFFITVVMCFFLKWSLSSAPAWIIKEIILSFILTSFFQ